MYYVYRFLDKKKNVIYVGKSKQDLELRFRGHKHLPDACYDLTYRIEYIECSTESDMAIKEIYYINRFRHDGTFFNVLDTADVPASVEFSDKWKQYKGYLGPQFSHSINYVKGYATSKEIRYTKDGVPDRRRSNKEAGVDSYVEGLTSDEVDLLVRYLVDEINEAENNNQEQIRFRNLLMFVLGVNVPHNVNDFLCLRYCDLFDENDQPKALELQLGRFHKDGIVMIPLRDSVQQVLIAYTRKYGLSYAANADEPLFQSRKHQIVSAKAWWRISSFSAKAVGINKNIGAGSLRKTYGLNIYDRSADKLQALLFLGELWGNVRESKIISYLNLTDSEIDFDYYLGKLFRLAA